MEPWIQMTVILCANLFVVLLMRKESRADIKELREYSREDWQRCQNTIDAIQKEVTDFHRHLLEIEKSRTNGK